MDEFLKYQDKLVAGEDVSGYKFSGEVTQMPKQFNEWVKANEKRIKFAKSLPYFIRDNYVGGDISKGLKFQSVAQLTKTNVFTEATSMTEVVERLKRCGIKEIEIGGDVTLYEANIVLEAVEEESRYRNLELNRFGVASNLHKKSDLGSYHTKGEIGGFYNAERKVLYIEANNFRQSIYCNLGTWDERITALEEKIITINEEVFVKRGISKYDVLEQICSTRDTIKSLIIKYGAGHPTAYFKKLRMSETEYLAHAFENAFLGNRIFEKYLPDIYEEMIGYINSLKKLF